MKIELSSKNIDLLPSLTEYANEKLGAIARHIHKFEMEGDVHLKARVGRITSHHQKGEVFEASADMGLPGVSLHASKTHEDLHTAIDLVRDALVQEIEKYKAKHS